jgi:hypothetical protein
MGQYQPSVTSLALPLLSASAINQFLGQRFAKDATQPGFSENALIKQFWQWLRQQIVG